MAFTITAPPFPFFSFPLTPKVNLSKVHPVKNYPLCRYIRKNPQVAI